MARPKRSELDELIDNFCRKTREERDAILYSLQGAHRAMCSFEAAPKVVANGSNGAIQSLFVEVGEQAAEIVIEDRRP